MTKTHRTAFLGTGLMGLPMARNLARAGVPLTVWNRSRSKAESIVPDGAALADSPADAVTNAGVVISMFADFTVTEGVAALCLADNVLRPGAIWIDMASTRPEEARALAATLQACGVEFIDAPVSGGTKGAEDGTLAIMAGGEQDTIEQLRPVLAAMGRPVRVGPVGAGQLAKLANQAIVAATIGAVAEAMLLLERGGAEPAAVRDALKGGFADSTILQQHGRRMTERDFAPGGLSRLQLRDLDNVLSEAQALGLRLPVVEGVHARFDRYISELGGGERDHSGLYEELLDLNGLGR